MFASMNAPAQVKSAAQKGRNPQHFKLLRNAVFNVSHPGNDNLTHLFESSKTDASFAYKLGVGAERLMYCMHGLSQIAPALAVDLFEEAMAATQTALRPSPTGGARQEAAPSAG